MARECGWTVEYIINNLTLQQVERYYETIQSEKIKDSQLSGMIQSYAVAYGSGNMKGDKFMEFIKSLDPRNKKDINEAINRMKEKNLPIEDN